MMRGPFKSPYKTSGHGFRGPGSIWEGITGGVRHVVLSLSPTHYRQCCCVCLGGDYDPYFV
jgi:hypothetical protein